jgi:hypothetical protein
LSFAEVPVANAGAPITDAAPAVIPTVSTNPRRVIPSVAMILPSGRVDVWKPDSRRFRDVSRSG